MAADIAKRSLVSILVAVVFCSYRLVGLDLIKMQQHGRLRDSATSFTRKLVFVFKVNRKQLSMGGPSDHSSVQARITEPQRILSINYALSPTELKTKSSGTKAMNKRTYVGIILLTVGLILGGCSALDGLGVPQLDLFGNNGAQLVQRIDLSPAAQRDHLGQYQNDLNHKAFAVSPDGQHGVAFNYESVSEATDAALNACRGALSAGDLDCTIYDLNGTIVLQTPVNLSPYNP